MDFQNDVYPDSNNHPQSIINNQIGIEYDIYLSFIKFRLGTPTLKFQSGVIEEYEIAVENNKPIMLFFSNSLPKTRDELDSEQFNLVENFRKNLTTNKTLYHTYSNIDDLDERLICMISWKIDSLHSYSKSFNPNLVFDLDVDIPDYLDDELGDFVDFDEFMESYEESTYELAQILKNILNVLTINLSDIENKMSSGLEHELQTRKKKAKQIFKNVAGRIKLFRKQCITLSESLQEKYESISKNLSRAIIFFPTQNLTDKEIDTLLYLHNTISEILSLFNELKIELSRVHENLFNLRKFSMHIKKEQKLISKILDSISEQVSVYHNRIDEFEFMYFDKIAPNINS